MTEKLVIPDPALFRALPEGVTVDVTLETSQVRVTFPELAAEGVGAVMAGEPGPDGVRAAIQAAERVFRGGSMESRAQALFREVQRLRGQINP
jgi:hypothetical protein